MKKTFIVGPIGGGIAEVSSVLCFAERGESSRPTFPAEWKDNILIKYITVDGSHGGIEESRYLMNNNGSHTFAEHNKLIAEAINEHATASHVFLLGTGLSLFVKNFIEEYPDATVYFVKRQDNNEDLKQIIAHSEIEEMCECGAYHIPATEDFQQYINSINDRIKASLDYQLEKLGLKWTSVPTNDLEKFLIDNVPFMAPTLISVYKP